MSDLLCKKEAAKRLRVSERTLDRERDAGRLCWVQVGGKVFFLPEQLDQYIRSQVKGGNRSN